MRNRFFLIALIFAAMPAPARADWAYQGTPLTSAPRAQSALALIPDGSGGAFAAWTDERSSPSRDIFLQHVSGSGSRLAGWQPNGDSVTTLPCHRDTIGMSPDGTGGALVAWTENRCTYWNDIYALRVTASGGIASGWVANGTPVCTMAQNDKRMPAVVSDGAGGAFVSWQDRRNAWPREIYIQHLTAAGAIASGWPVGGRAVNSAVSDQLADALIADGSGGVFVVWQDKRAGNDIYLQHILGDGSLSPGWNPFGVPVCDAPGDQQDPVMVADGSGGVVVAWRDHRDGVSDDIYALRVTGGGARAAGWPANGIPVCTAAGDQQAPAITGDGAGGVIVGWQDHRDAAFDVYAQRLDGSGAVAAGWPADGAVLSRAAGDQLSPQVAADGSGGAFATWADGRSGSFHVFAQHISGAGVPSPGWSADGTALCIEPGNQRNPQIVSDGAGGAITAWVDTRTSCDTTAEDIYAMGMTAAGPALATVRDLAALHHTGQTFLTWTRPTGLGWTYRVYASSQPIVQASDFDAATFLGSVGDSSWCDLRLLFAAGALYGYAIDSLAAPLTATQGLFVATPATSGSVYYAVTVQLGACAENRTVIAGENALSLPVLEVPAAPRPVFQRKLAVSGRTGSVYTLWVSDQPTPFFPAMATAPGMAFDCGVVPGDTPPQNSLLLAVHHMGGNFVNGMATSSGIPGEWVLALDDPLYTRDGATWWYGTHEAYDRSVWINPVPSSGTVHDCTLERVLYTILWARSNFPVDTTRVYARNGSLGAIGTTLIALRRPDLIAAAMTIVGKYDFSYLSDPNPLSLFNPGGWYREIADRLWGTVASNLPSTEGLPVYDALNAGFMAARMEPRSLPPIFSFNGRNDIILGWAEKIPFFHAMEEARQGGCFFWDQRDHGGGPQGAWTTMEDARYLARFRTNLSFPALSNCSADGNPGDGSPTSGDSVGTINGFVEWDTTLVDQRQDWQTTLWLRPLLAYWGQVLPPESLTVDVTPRRTQAFHPVYREPCDYTVTRLNGGAQLQSGTVTVDSLGRVTIPAVRVLRAGSVLHIHSAGLAAIPPAARPPLRLTLALSRNPVRGPTSLAVSWPRSGRGTVEVLDVVGRRALTLWNGPVSPGTVRLTLDSAALPSGLYFVVARDRDHSVVQRAAILR